MSLPILTLNDAVFWTSAIASIGIAYDALEFYTKKVQVLDDFFDWRIIRSRYYIFLGRPCWNLALDFLFSRRAFLWLLLAHGIAALLFPLAVLESHSAACVLAGVVLSVHCLSNVRLLVGRDGADQMQTIVWAGLFLYCLPTADWAKLASVGLIVAQLTLSYLISGLAKAVSPVWRSGVAVALILRMATYCPRDLSNRLTAPAISLCLCWMTIGFELTAPFLMLAGRPGALGLAVLGTLFHGGIAVAMGLTTFVFSFVAAFPLVYYFAGLIG